MKSRFSLLVFIAAAVSTLAFIVSDASAQRTSRGRLSTADAPASQAETRIPEAKAVLSPSAVDFKVSGYDKPLRSRRETFFAANHLPEGTVERVAATITYLDASGKMLHKRSVSINCDIPSGETRNLSTPSWDKQQSFYYVRSAVPVHASKATPYDVTIEIDTLFVR